ncbi:hypothetical protein GSI_05422 [Ganoderma sinense ZZ0214-1]|uniref:peptidylprolyl isomerase n=1 Tax=Ganoderma sinense ZZ0214-1 TaxID=1077348 RepID=A0A2G8SEQ2_9APHY|nr:hypothetical protein GSI_05422 [Ganoderma sinense ZZ0214-1]
MVRPRVFFDVTIDDQPSGRIIFELFNGSAPKACENFRALCTGEKGLSPISERPLYYKNSIVHRSIRGFMIQGGDFTKRNGTGGESIYGGPFSDEDLTRPLDSEGLLCMANKGPNTNNSQFFITLRDCPHLNGKHVVFGRVIRGYEVAERIAEVSTDEKDRPRLPVVISNSGELMLRAQAQTQAQQGKKAATESESEQSDRDSEGELRRRRKKRRHSSRSPSRDRARSQSRSPPPSGDSEDDRKQRRSSKKKDKEKKRKDKSKKHKRSRSESRPRTPAGEPVSETESQYDARLEREENERIEAARKRELERMARRLKEEEERRSRDSGGVRFKGRGRMKYVDPELQRDGRR